MRPRVLRGHRHPEIGKLIAILLGCFIPYVGRILVAGDSENLTPLHITLVTSLLASVLSLAAMRSIHRYPGAEASATILSTLSVIFAVLMAALLISRIDYARGPLFMSFGLCCLFLFIQHLRWPSSERLRIAVIPGGAVKSLPSGEVEWVTVSDPTASFDEFHAVTVDLRTDLSTEWERAIAELALSGTPVYHIKHLRESLTGRVELEHLSETSYGTLSPSPAYIQIKRAIDIVISAIALLICVPVMTVVAILIRLDSRGPVIFRQRRMGFRGQPFTVYKFRTMHMSDPVHSTREDAMTRENDNRITKVGRLLRMARLDEIPQLVNVIRSEMSLIGPRPEAEVLSHWYEQEIPFYRYRHTVLPGVTGWAQINQGHVTDVDDVKAKLHYDFYYIKNISPWIDFLITVRTILVMFTGHGAR